MESQHLDLSLERKECDEFYEILWHIWVFIPLTECVFPEMKDNIHQTKEARENFLRNKFNLKRITDFFEDDENVEIFSKKLVSFYLKHKKAFDKLWIGNKHKNLLSVVIHVLNQSQYNYSRVLDDIERYVKDDVNQIIDWLKRQKDKIIWWDSKWNLIWNMVIEDPNEWLIKFNWNEGISLINWVYIYTETRTPVN